MIVANKWDLVKEAMETERMGKYIRTVFPMLDYVPIAFVTAKKGKNALRLLHLAVQLHKQASSRVGTTIRAWTPGAGSRPRFGCGCP